MTKLINVPSISEPVDSAKDVDTLGEDCHGHQALRKIVLTDLFHQYLLEKSARILISI